MTQSQYDKCLAEMFGLRRFGIKLGLDIIDAMLKALDRPERKFACIHVAGTNGKGSIASALAAILQTAGLRVGLYTSPHLVRFNERICINNQYISDHEVVNAWHAAKAAAPKEREATFFEYTTAMALYAFARAEVDWAVIETGMGGRMDATNILQPRLCIISNISLEHRFYLGSTIAQITGEKAGIIKPDTPVITGVHQKSAIEVIEKTAARNNAPVFRKGKDFRIRRSPKSDAGNFGFTYKGIDHKWTDMRSSLQGIHQLDNAALVLAACEVLMDQGTAIDVSRIKDGLANVRWPGRLEMIDTTPPMILDGAHNLIAARRLAAFLSDTAADKNITLVIGILDDKPCQAMLNTLVPLCQRVIVTRPVIDRSLPARVIEAGVKKLTDHVEIVESVRDAVFYAMETTANTDLICVAGSLYVVGEAKAALEGARAPEPV
ncbi:dihydrofolate synthase/folylpolyglutamate synthase [Desulfosalsimonas propionicica]|uniref:Dihydrofolate synthase/folylpolyglutamate synthase n=1 Tax=Desulfosalsimonas propionicica TaxID=332175 RepID=A0A7W0HK37_9BACT|nr:folylpolyglutamate synthase/dihydrofolate synthase family protein [Desulfosalsimonas propionicica]MBA2880879.1 dihydrofolate synthase/folylpolyglutamate synthase [Desulfosalsimonas propionicica]